MITSSNRHLPRYCTFVWGIYRSPVNSPQTGQWRGALMFSYICTWINNWANNRRAGDLRRHSAHNDVVVMNMSDVVASVVLYDIKMQVVGRKATTRQFQCDVSTKCFLTKLILFVAVTHAHLFLSFLHHKMLVVITTTSKIVRTESIVQGEKSQSEGVSWLPCLSGSRFWAQNKIHHHPPHQDITRWYKWTNRLMNPVSIWYELYFRTNQHIKRDFSPWLESLADTMETLNDGISPRGEGSN